MNRTWQHNDSLRHGCPLRADWIDAGGRWLEKAGHRMRGGTASAFGQTFHARKLGQFVRRCRTVQENGGDSPRRPGRVRAVGRSSGRVRRSSLPQRDRPCRGSLCADGQASLRSPTKDICSPGVFLPRRQCPRSTCPLLSRTSAWIPNVAPEQLNGYGPICTSTRPLSPGAHLLARVADADDRRPVAGHERFL